MENGDISELVERLGSSEDAVRKMAAFKLQSNIGDPSFADVFISEGGLTRLRFLVLRATGNTLAYSLSALAKLLEVDMGWEYVNAELVERGVQLVVNSPLPNILRGAMSVLAGIVAHNQMTEEPSSPGGSPGLRALKPAIAIYPQFLTVLVSHLSSDDHGLCANALQLINALMRDAIFNSPETEWPRFIKRLQELGTIKNAYGLMQGSAAQDLAQPLLEFQTLMKVLLRKWRDRPVDMENTEHRRALRGLYLVSSPEKMEKVGDDETKRSKRHNPEVWHRLGFEGKNPTWEFQDAGFMGLMDLIDYVGKDEGSFQRLLLEQATQSADDRCPIARASLAVTSILYSQFEVDRYDLEDAKNYLVVESRRNLETVFKPLLLQWSRLHTAGLHAFLRLWKATGAQADEFLKVEELVERLIDHVVGQAPRTRDISEIEVELAEFDYDRLRELQMEARELKYEQIWGQHLSQVREELNNEALQFVREQRIRCLLQGAWFPDKTYKSDDGPVTKNDLHPSEPISWRFVRLNPNRRFLHYGVFDQQGDSEPSLEQLPERIDLTAVSSVQSNVTPISPPASSGGPDVRPGSTTPTLTHPHPHRSASGSILTRITVHGYSTANPTTPAPLLTLHPPSQPRAAEWLDGLLMAMDQAPLTRETQDLVALIDGLGMTVRLLNVRFDEMLRDRWARSGGGEDVDGVAEVEIPSRDGVDDEFWYAMAGEDA